MSQCPLNIVPKLFPDFVFDPVFSANITSYKFLKKLGKLKNAEFLLCGQKSFRFDLFLNK